MTILTYTSVARTCCDVLTCWIKSTAQNFALYNVSFKYIYNIETKWLKYTECAPARLTIGASRLLVLWTVRISPLFRSSFAEDIAIWLLGGGVALALLTTAAPSDGDSDRLDIFSERQRNLQTSVLSGKCRSRSILSIYQFCPQVSYYSIGFSMQGNYLVSNWLRIMA